MEEEEKKWNLITDFISEKFGDGEEIDIDGILYLIGIRELGEPLRTYKKDEKLDILHIAICRVLSPLGYYSLIGKDEEGWPHYEKIEDLPPLKAGEQNYLIKMAIVRYFEDERLLNED